MYEIGCVYFVTKLKAIFLLQISPKLNDGFKCIVPPKFVDYKTA